jgi:hypothetical protein
MGSFNCISLTAICFEWVKMTLYSLHIIAHFAILVRHLEDASISYTSYPPLFIEYLLDHTM